MKKFIVLFILLLGLGGTGFYFGWVQLEVPAQSLGVIFTKTGGWEAQTVRPGAFTWRWERLIPGNLSLYLYPDKTYTAEIDAEGSLPSAQAYGLFLDGNPSFAYSVRFSVGCRVKAEYFPVLARDQGVLPETLEEWFASVRTGISAKTSAAVAAWFEKSSAETLLPGAAEKELTGAIRAFLAADYPFLEVTEIAPVRLSLPDTALYVKARELYLERADGRKESLRQNAREAADRGLKEDARMESLKKYGELLTQYPPLLEFLKIEKDLAAPAGR
jgi:hypothetical protein